MLFLAACNPSTSHSPSVSPSDALAEVNARENKFPSYPRANTTYLSFDHAHGFQVNYIGANGKAWLWYPGNRGGVDELWKTETIRGTRAVCFAHPSNSYNPVTKQHGGSYSCSPLVLSQKSNVASLAGDPFDLSSGSVPYVLSKCQAPEAFKFDRARFKC
ncbi:hypothetical protein [Roseovarius albus]|nr:hypothetical protein [Roseovarius albus]